MSRIVKLDMTDVESYSKASEGIHTAKVVEILEKDTQAGDPMLQFAFEIVKGDDKGCKVFDNFTLTDKALWKFKAFLDAVGVKSDGKIKIDLDKLVGKVCDIEVFWDEYNGQTRAKISDYYKANSSKVKDDDEDDEYDDEDNEDEEEEKPAPKKKGRPAKSKKSEPDDDDDEDEDEKPSKKSSKKSKKDDDDEDDEWEEDDD